MINRLKPAITKALSLTLAAVPVYSSFLFVSLPVSSEENNPPQPVLISAEYEPWQIITASVAAAAVISASFFIVRRTDKKKTEHAA